MSKWKQPIPRGLQRRIYSFGLAIIIVIASLGVLLWVVSKQSMRSYQQILEKITEVQQIKININKLSETIEEYVISSYADSQKCIAEWHQIADEIDRLKADTSETSILLVKDIQHYQDNTASAFFSVIQGQNTDHTLELYQEFLLQQSDRLFLCDLLLNHLIEQSTEQYPTIASQTSSYLTIFIAILICLLILVMFFSWSLSDNIYKPVKCLVSQAEEMMKGNYQIADLQVRQQNEIGYLADAFNKMKDQIQQNFQDQEELWRLESSLQDAEYRALQSQVNPHFLFNVLSMATEAALTENANKTVDIIENISYMLRYSLTSVREDTLLTDELKMLNSYLFLQKKRFGNRIRFELRILEDIPKIQIPGMTLQPIVENAVMHGVEHMTGGCFICVSMVREKNVIEICVHDNGCGMPDELVDALNRGENLNQTAKSTGLGIINVRNRLEQYYHENGLLTIQSKENEGTSVYLRYPIRRGTPNVSDTDC